MPRRLRIATQCVLAAYVAVVLFITLWPAPVDKPVSDDIRIAIDTANNVGEVRPVGSSDFAYGILESSANVLLFIPIGLLLAVLLRASSWWFAPVLGLSLSIAIEFTQFVALPDRTASPMDIAWNATGALIGALIVVAVRRFREARRARVSRG